MELDENTRVLTKKIIKSSNKSCEDICNLQKIGNINGTCLSHIKKVDPKNYKNIHCFSNVTAGNLCYCIVKPREWTNITDYSWN